MFHRLSQLVLLLLVVLAGTPAVVSASEAEGLAFFESKVRPLLIEHCLECHSTETKQKGGLVLDSRSGWQAGGDSGPAVVPGKVEQSRLIEAVRYLNPNLEMPPKAKLPAADIAVLERWVAAGAHDPRETAAVAKKSGADAEMVRNHWAWQPLREVKPPAVSDAAWRGSAIDAFVAAGLEARGLRPAPPASRHALIRRLAFDLTGMPPTPEEIKAFCEDSAPRAVEALVERLLASPRFGERWGRHWLDVARYSDSIGGGMNYVLDDAWRYRDYVVASFNADKPYDRFVTEQIAGDLLPAGDEAQRTEQLIATGFLMLGPNELGEYDREKLRMDIVDEQLDTLGKAFLGLTLGCARCHDHKFDPVPARDYYAMAGILRSTSPFDEKKSTGLFAKLKRLPLAQDPAGAAALARATEKLANLKNQLAEAQTAAKTTPEDGKKEAEERVKALRDEIKRGESAVSALTPMALAVGEEEKPADSPIFVRGDVHNPGAMVPRGFLTLARLDRAPAVPQQQSGRLEMAKWLTDRNHPLPARVMANRVWHWLTGSGIVRSVDNFGVRGEAPSHPELLDFLARRFIECGWSVKTLVRDIVLSRTYQQSGWPVPDAVRTDPDNRLHGWHGRRRLEAEEIHDALLAFSGAFEERIGGRTNIRTGRLGSEGEDATLDHDPGRRRGLYQPIYRGGLAPDLFLVFDFPDAGLVTGSRNITTVAPQALFLMNSPFILEKARLGAARLLRESTDDDGRISSLYLRLLGRPPTAPEAARAQAFLAGTPGNREAAWAAFSQSLLISSPFLFVE
jgi:hypothetical protein